jgi:peroxiredoxin Q/BCP
MALLEVGATAPGIDATTGNGAEFKLGEQLGSNRIMLVFYPKDFTPGCTTQLVNVQRSLDAIRAAGVEPYGVNPDEAESHRNFCSEYQLEFDLIVDEDLAAATAYGAVRPDGGVLRSVFVIGQDGKVQYAGEGAPSWDDVSAAIAG